MQQTFGEEINWSIWLWVLIFKHSTKALLLNIWLSNSNVMLPFKNLLGGNGLPTQAQVSLLHISNSPSNGYSVLISFQIDWFDLLAAYGTLKSLLQYHSLIAWILQRSAFFMIQLSHPYMTTGKTIALTTRTFVSKVTSLLFNLLSIFVIAFLPRMETSIRKLYGILGPRYSSNGRINLEGILLPKLQTTLKKGQFRPLDSRKVHWFVLARADWGHWESRRHPCTVWTKDN